MSKEASIQEIMDMFASDYAQRTKGVTMPSNFYLSTYQCGNCGSALYKTVFPVGGEFEFYEKISPTKVKSVYIKRLFTCHNCCTLLAPRPGDRLSDRHPLIAVISDRQDYENILSEINKFSTTNGRVDL